MGRILLVIILSLSLFDSNHNQDSSLAGTKWVSKGSDYFKGDTLTFSTKNEVKYYLGELEFIFNSTYSIEKDTLEILTKTTAFELEDVSKLLPDLCQKYLIQNDSLTLIYLANRRNDKWVKTPFERLLKINNYYKLK